MGIYKAYCLDGCPYSIEAKELIQANIPKEKREIIPVSQEDKHEYKNTVKDGVVHPMNSFPQIYYYPSTQGKISKDVYGLIGGLSELKAYIKDTSLPIKPLLKGTDSELLKVMRDSISKRFKDTA